MSKWKKIKLGDVATYVNGYAFKPSDWSDNGLPIIRIQNLTGNDYETNFYSGEYQKKYEVNTGDILISWSASLGVYEWKKELALLNQHIFKVVFDKLNVDKRYFFHTVTYLLEDMSKETHGSTMKHITKPRFDNTPFPFPPLETQKQIAANLDKVTHTINLCNEILEKLDLLVKSRFVEMFGKPDINPLNWKEDVLSEHLEVIGGYAFKSDKFEENGIPVLRIGNINSGCFLPVNMVYWNNDPVLERYKMYPGDLVMSLTGTVGKDDYGNVCILGADYPEYYLNQRNAKLSLKSTLNARYLSELLRFESIKRRLTGISRGVRQANISNKDILCLCVPVPPIELQTQFADFVTQTDKSKLAVKQVLEKAETLKKALMQEYFG